MLSINRKFNIQIHHLLNVGRYSANDKTTASYAGFICLAPDTKKLRSIVLGKNKQTKNTPPPPSERGYLGRGY